MNSEASDKAGTPLPSSEQELGSRLLAVIEMAGTRQKAAEIAGRSTDQLGKYVKGAAEPPFLPVARLCMAAGRSMEWLATGVEPANPLQDKASAPSQALTLDNVKLAVQLLREALDDADADLTPAKHGEAVVLLVKLLENGLPPSDIRPLARQTVSVITGDRADAGKGKAAAGR